MIPPPLRCIQRSAEDRRAGETDSGARGVVDLAARPIRSVTKRSAERLKAPRSPCAPSLLPYLQTVGGNFMKHTVALKQNHEFRRLYSKGKSAVSPYFAIYCRKTKRPNSRLGITTGAEAGQRGEAQPRPPPYPGALPHQ
ncbi:MAG: ribonuclease P protein component [Lawsonibacter sp.]